MSTSRAASIRRFVALVVVAAVVAAACSGGDDTGAGPDAAPTATPVADDGSGGDDGTVGGPQTDTDGEPTDTIPDDPTPLPVDPDVRVGRLDNGLTYYLRDNQAPGGRAELRLVVGVGSIHEDDDQSGVAHFLEHMLFNGTERYPANELVRVLESFGSEFGPDVNASTSFDETVYQLSIPTDDDDLIDEAFDVLAEWASRATIDPAEVEAERGVVVEEWRLRTQGTSGRILSTYAELLADGTVYDDRLPIGELDMISTMTAEPIRRFYEDWYRPDLMAVVVVGDLDLDAAEDRIVDRFGDLTGPDDPRPEPVPDIVDRDTFAYASLADPDLPTSYIELVWDGPAEPLTTVGDLRRALAYELAASVIDERFADDVLRGDAPFLRAYASTTPLTRSIDTPGLLAEAEPEALEASLEALLVEVQRLRRDGIEQAELDRAIAARQAAADQALAGVGTIQDGEHAAAIVEAHLAEEPLSSTEQLHELETRLLGEITPDEVVAAFVSIIDRREPLAVVVGPEADAAAFPDEDAVRGLIESVGDDVPARVDEAADVDELMVAPEPAEVVSERTIEGLDATVVELANGVVVAVRPTTIEDNAFIVRAERPGGLSALDEDQLAAAFAAPRVVPSSGLADLDQVTIDRLLADRVVSAQFGFGETATLVEAAASTDDAELLFQLLHLSMTEPRATDTALATFVAEAGPFVEDPASVPGLATGLAITEARFGDSPWFRLVPSPDDLDALAAADVLSAFEAGFGDAGGLVVTIVGDLEVDTAVDLARRYLGTLPVDTEPDEWVDRRPDPPSGVVDETVRVGADPQGSVTMLLSAELEVDTATSIALDALELVVGARLRDRLREELGATYSPSVQIGPVVEPDGEVETIVEVSADPEALDPVVDEIRAVLAALAGAGGGAGAGVTEAEAATAIEQVRRDLELVSNIDWVERIGVALDDPDDPVVSIPERIAVARGLSASALTALAADVFPSDRAIVVRTVPATG